MKAACVLLGLLILAIPVIASISADSLDKSGPPSGFDWREHGIMTPVKHQGDCGSCGEFAGVAMLEALVKKERGIEIDLSEQQIMSCVPGCGCNTGCSALSVLNHIKKNGIVLESDIPYANKDTDCTGNRPGRYFISDVLTTEIAGTPLASRIKTIKETLLKYGPVATNMAFFEDLDRYRSGIYSYDGKSREVGGHWVVIVGWKDSLDISTGGYWICRNSWGNKWGYDGYFLSAYGESGIDDYYIVYGRYKPPVTDEAQNQESD